LADWSLIRRETTPENTFIGTDIGQMYCIIPEVVPFDLGRYVYEVGTEPDIPEFYLSLQNFCYDKALEVTVKAPPFVRVFSKGTDIELDVFRIVPRNPDFDVGSVQRPPLFLGPPSDPDQPLPPLPGVPPVFGFTGADLHGLFVMKVVFDDQKAIQDPEFILGPMADGTYTLEFEFTPLNVTGPVYVWNNILCPEDINVIEDPDDIGDDGTGEEPPEPEEEDDRVTIVIEEGDTGGDILWIDGTTGRIWNNDDRGAENYRELPDDWVSLGGMMFPPDIPLTPCIEQLLRIVDRRNDVPPLGHTRRGFQLDPWDFLAGPFTADNQDEFTFRITAQTWECVIGDIGKEVNDFRIPRGGFPRVFRGPPEFENAELRRKMRDWVEALVKLVRLRQFFVNGGTFDESQQSNQINREYGRLVEEFMPPPLARQRVGGVFRLIPQTKWGAFGVGSRIIDWGDHIERDSTRELLAVLRRSVDLEEPGNDQFVFAWAFKQLIELLEDGKEIPTGRGASGNPAIMQERAAPYSSTVASIFYDIQEKGEGDVPELPGPYETEEDEEA